MHASPDSRVSESERPQRLGLVLLVISAAQLMVVLDATIVNIALPSIKADLDLSDASLQWVITSYTLAFGGLLLLGGRAGDILGRKRVFIAGILLFTLGSLLGGLAWNEMTLLGGRVIQGLGAAVAAPTALSLVATEFPEGKARNQAMAVYAAMSGAGAAIGLILGGVLTDLLNWRWVLFVNVPIGLFIAFVAPRVLHETKRHSGLFDLPGALTATAGLGSLVYGLTHAAQVAGEIDPSTGFPRGASAGWSDTVTIVTLLVSVVLLATFFVIERRSEHALMPMRIFSDRNRSGAYAVMLIVGAAMFAMFFFLTLFVQGILGYSPLRSGFAFLPVSVFIVISAGLSSVLIGKFGPRPLTLAGTLTTAAGMFWLAQIDVDTTYVSGLLLPTVLMATGLGFTFMPLTLAAVSRIENKDAGLASGVLNTTQQVGGALGLATLSTISIAAATSEAGNLSAAAAAGRSSVTGPEAIQAIAAVQGYSTALHVAAGMALLAFVVSFFTIKIRAEEAVEAQPVPVG